jgi:hypothetical protein
MIADRITPKRKTLLPVGAGNPAEYPQADGKHRS